MRSLWLFTIVVPLLLLATPAAHARADDAVDLHELLKRANTHYSLGKFHEAAKEYGDLYERRPDQPVLLYNIAQSWRQAGDLDKALFFYRSYLRNMKGAPNRVEVEDRVRELELVVGAQRRAPNEPASLEPPPAKTSSTGRTKKHRDKPAAAEPVKTTEPTRAATAPPSEPPHPAEAPPPARHPELTAAPEAAPSRDAEAKPIYKKWWLWTIVGGVVVAGGVTAAVVIGTSGGQSFNPNLGEIGPGSHSTALVGF